jgi:WD40 repeat protein
MTQTIHQKIKQALFLSLALGPLSIFASSPPLSVLFLEDNLQAIVASGGEQSRAVVFNPYTGETLRQFSLGEDSVTALSVSVAKNLLATSSVPGEIVVFNIGTGTPKRHLKTPQATVTKLSFSPSGKELAALTDNNTVILYTFEDSTTSKQISLNATSPATTLFYGESYNPNFYSIITEDLFIGFEDGTIQTYNIYSLHLKASNKVMKQGVTNGVHVFSVERRTAPKIHPMRTPPPPTERIYVILTSQWGDMALIDPESGSIRRRLAGHNTTINTLDFAKDGKLLATGAKDGSLKLWSAKTGTFLGDMVGHTASVEGLGLASTGRKMLSASQDGTVRLWDVGSKTELASYIFEVE